MATTKELLEKAMLRLGSRGARGDGVIATTYTTDPSEYAFQYFVAAADGFVHASAKANAFQGRCLSFSCQSGVWVFPTYDANSTINGTMPVAKGERFGVAFSIGTSSRYIGFIKSIGGGLGLLRKLLGVVEVNYGYA